MKRYYIGVLLVVISASCFALMPIFTVFAYKGNANFTTILFLRFGIAALLLFTYLACKKRNLAVNRKVLFKLLIIGGILYTLQSSLYFASIKYINVSLQAMLFYTYPIFVTILAVAIFKESFTKILLVSIAVSLTGMGMVLGTSFENINFLGVFLALAAAAVYSLYINLANRLVQDIPSDLATAYLYVFIACLPAGWNAEQQFEL
jgi:drug/metabolite transporter (DMT)-like permease